MIPATQVALFGALATANELFGVPAIVLEAVDEAESNGQPGFVNPEGYGGLFGLSADTVYDGQILSPAQLVGTDEASLTAQAITCAAEFARLLDLTNGQVFAAESLYQGGATEGVSVMQALGVPAAITPWPPAPKPEEEPMTVPELFSWDGKTYLITGGKAVLLTPNAVKAFAAAGITDVKDVEAGLYNQFFVGNGDK